MKHLFALAAALMCSACTTLSYDQLPGPTSTVTHRSPASAAELCRSLPAAAYDLKLIVPAPVRALDDGGCVADVRREPPWWLPGDDGERYRVQVRPAGQGGEITVHARRVAPGQVWLDDGAGALLARIERGAQDVPR